MSEATSTTTAQVEIRASDNGDLLATDADLVGPFATILFSHRDASRFVAFDQYGAYYGEVGADGDVRHAAAGNDDVQKAADEVKANLGDGPLPDSHGPQDAGVILPDCIHEAIEQARAE
jgi:hypothetical protein